MSKPFVRPDVATFLGYLNALPGPKIWEVDAPQARAMSAAMRDVADLPIGELAVRRDLDMPGFDGGRIPLRLYDARATRAPGPVLVFLHGGGWVLGSLDSYDPACAAIARGLDLPVVSVDYRLAPEHPWPAAPDDCGAAARWIATAPDALGLAPTALVLAGDSAGGNLAIITALALRDEAAAVPVAAHWALYPATDFTRGYPSAREFADGHFLTHEGIAWFNDAYKPDPQSWRASPMVADLTGLSPALVTTASLDPIRDQGRAYAAALANAGVAVSFREAAGTVHGFLNLRRALPSADADLSIALAALKAMLV